MNETEVVQWTIRRQGAFIKCLMATSNLESEAIEREMSSEEFDKVLEYGMH